VHRGPEHPAHHHPPPRSVDDGSADVAGRDGDVGAVLKGLEERIDGLDRDGEVGVEEDDRISGGRLDAGADGAALAAMGEVQVPVPQLRAREILDRRRVRGCRAIGRSVIGDDDLRRQSAGAEVLGAASEARR